MDDLPKPADAMTDLGQRIPANPLGERGLTNEPVYQGEPILAVCAVDELTAAEAIEKIQIDFEPLPLRGRSAGQPAARRTERARRRQRLDAPVRPTRRPPAPPPEVAEVKWTEEDFKEYNEGRLPMGKATDPEWTYGDVEAGFKNAALVLDETFVTPNTSHQSLETRTAMAYWQNGKVYVHCSHAEHRADRSGHRALARPGR